MKMQDFATRPQHNAGIVIQLRNSAGDETSALVRIRGIHSDAYRAAHDAFNQAMVRVAALVRANAKATLVAASQTEREEASLSERAALVSEWNLEEPCTRENVIALFRDAPYVGDQIFYAASDCDRFLESTSTPSSDGPNTVSVSVEALDPQATR